MINTNKGLFVRLISRECLREHDMSGPVMSRPDRNRQVGSLVAAKLTGVVCAGLSSVAATAAGFVSPPSAGQVSFLFIAALSAATGALIGCSPIAGAAASEEYRTRPCRTGGGSLNGGKLNMIRVNSVGHRLALDGATAGDRSVSMIDTNKGLFVPVKPSPVAN